MLAALSLYFGPRACSGRGAVKTCPHPLQRRHAQSQRSDTSGGWPKMRTQEAGSFMAYSVPCAHAGQCCPVHSVGCGTAMLSDA